MVSTGTHRPKPAPLTVILSGESYDTHWLLLLPDSYAWRVRACQDENCVQAGPWPDAWSFTYQAQPTPTPQTPQGRGQNGDGGIQTTYAITRRNTYFLAGQAVVMRRVVEGETNNLLHLHTDHLGSNSVMSHNNGSGMVSGSRTRYLPFGDYRTVPTQTFTDRGYTSQKHNNDLGLIYYNARYYLPGVGRFVSADTLIPNPANPQALNRYSYVENRPLSFTDPTGHWLESAWDAFNIGLGIASLADNLKQGNYGSAAIDALGLVVDAAALVLPAVPGGVGAIIKGARGADAAVDAVQTINQISNAAQVANQATNAAQTVNQVTNAFRFINRCDACTGQMHHILSTKIMRGLGEHPTLRGIFKRDDMITQALDRAAHNGYQQWHRLYDDEVVKWLRDNPMKSREEFLQFLSKIYSRDEMLQRFPSAVDALEEMLP